MKKKCSERITAVLVALAGLTDASKDNLEVFNCMVTRQWSDHRIIDDQAAFDIFHSATPAADEMMMVGSVWIETYYPTLEDLSHHSLALQPVKRVINCRPRSHGKLLIDRLQYFVCRRVMNRRL
jgi:hypothetical protein